MLPFKTEINIRTYFLTKKTLNPEPGTWNPELGTRNSDSEL